MRRAVRRDETEAPIVEGLERAGYQVYRMNQPCDLLVRNRSTGKIDVLEVHGGKRTGTGARRAQQLEFIRDWQVPLVSSLEDALRALGTRML